MDDIPVVPLSRLSAGFCQYYIIVKVDRIIYKDVVRYPGVTNHPMREQASIQLVVFDAEVCLGFFCLMLVYFQLVVNDNSLFHYREIGCWCCLMIGLSWDVSRVGCCIKRSIG